MAAEGQSVSAIARALGTCRSRVNQWRDRFLEQRLEGLEDLPRSGTGSVLGRGTTQRTRPDFLSFMDEVAAAYRQRRVHVILDNLNTHRDTRQGDFMTAWNRHHGQRFVFHYTPTHGSWLNQVELWFCVLSRRILRYGEFHSPEDLVAAIEAFIRQWNEKQAHPFRWTYEGLPLVR